MRIAGRALGLASVVLLHAAIASADPPRATFEAANRALFAGDHAAAAEGYERIVDAGIADPDVYFNLGVAYAEIGALGRSMVAFERALVLRPGDQDARSSLDRVERLLASRLSAHATETSRELDRGLFEGLGASFPEHVLAYLVLTLNLCAFGGLAGLLWSRREAIRIAFGIVAPVSFVLLIVAGLALLGRMGAFSDGAVGIIVEDRIEMREGPDPNARRSDDLREGQRVRVLARHGPYFEIAIPRGPRGWVDRRTVGLVGPGPDEG